MQIFINTREGQFNYWAVEARHRPGKSTMTLCSGRLGESLNKARIKTRTNPVPETINHNRDALIDIKLRKGYVRYPHDFECLLADVENGHVHPGTEFSPGDSMFAPPSIASGTRETIMIKTTDGQFEYWRILLEMIPGVGEDPGCIIKEWHDSLDGALRPPQPTKTRFASWPTACRFALGWEHRLSGEGYTPYGREFMFLDGDVSSGLIKRGEIPPGIETARAENRLNAVWSYERIDQSVPPFPGPAENRLNAVWSYESIPGYKPRYRRKRSKKPGRKPDPVRPEDMSSVIPGRVKRRIEL
jgi:hypothetical protein